MNPTYNDIPFHKYSPVKEIAEKQMALIAGSQPQLTTATTNLTATAINPSIYIQHHGEEQSAAISHNQTVLEQQYIAFATQSTELTQQTIQIKQNESIILNQHAEIEKNKTEIIEQTTALQEIKEQISYYQGMIEAFKILTAQVQVQAQPQYTYLWQQPQ